MKDIESIAQCTQSVFSVEIPNVTKTGSLVRPLEEPGTGKWHRGKENTRRLHACYENNFNDPRLEI